ncbi:unnamed protein product [Rotaria sordida]|uniref:Ubiquitin-activating enzyme E1 C-terminal domain-containing protein n=1 Tax=Rotaria sordida TaxID=392033 RepID=A0A814C1E3_9BILA|nr:unnamed protein product [Rotaria sordida]CAF3542031.1 unnamed protein product [Rotaria sordida]
MTTQIHSIDEDIDDQLYNRQRYVLGDDAMKRLRKHHVLIIHAGGLGIEIAKNIVLAGVQSVTLQDTINTSILDLATQYYLCEKDIGKNRAECSLEKLRALNDYVKVYVSKKSLSDCLEEYLKQFTCVVLTECNLDEMKTINEICRINNIIFIMADIYGVFSRCFVDCGNDPFTVYDKDGEQLKEIFINHISPEGTVTVAGDERHPFQDGDIVSFRELVGLENLNNCERTIKDLNIHQFSIGDISSLGGEYKRGGIAREVKQQIKLNFKSLNEQIHNPKILTIDGSDYWTKNITGEIPDLIYIHVIMLAVSEFKKIYQRLPEPHQMNQENDETNLLKLAQLHLNGLTTKDHSINENRFNHLLKCLVYTAKGSFAPLCSAMGGFVGQQVLTSITGKFTPIQQWLYLDAYELIKEISFEDEYNKIKLISPDRYQSLRLCIGEELVQCLARQRLFMVGCGAIGCELLKLFALLGVGRNGEITITDHDHIEKSNLNRQFLFHKQHLNQPKSIVAAQSARDMNNELKIQSYTLKVGVGSNDLCSDAFMCDQTIIVNALDNIEARRYMDSRCVTNKKPLIESGTMGPKGHTFVVVPYKSESYSNQSDPIDKDVPYCNVKSFPANIEHCTIWAREKFESTFHMKPSLYNSVMSQTNIWNRINNGETIDDLPKIYKFMKRKCTNWNDCLNSAREKFDKYFSNKARDLLHKFPADMIDDKGIPYWKLPKRAPTPTEFNINNNLHYDFVLSCAKLFAVIYNIQVNKERIYDVETNKNIILQTKIETWQPRNKIIITDPAVAKPVSTKHEGDISTDEWRFAQERTKDFQAVPIPFEKDDDFQIDFITTATNLRAHMYGLEPSDRYEIKRIAGRIVPAIGTTTATVSGLIIVELVKLCFSQMKDLPLSVYRNFYINIALPFLIASEPLACTTQKIGKFDVNIWSSFEIKGNPDMTLEGFIKEVERKYDIKPALISEGVKSVYAPWMPKASSQLKRKMDELLPHKPNITYSDLVVLPDENDMDVQLDSNVDATPPPIRYYFNS